MKKKSISIRNICKRGLAVGVALALAVGMLPNMPAKADDVMLDVEVNWARQEGVTLSSAWTVPVEGETACLAAALGNINDGIKNDANNFGVIGVDAAGSRSCYLQMDLGAERSIEELKLYRYWEGSRRFNATVIALSNNADFSQYTIVYNSDSATEANPNGIHGLGAGTDETYTESSAGKEIIWSDGAKSARYIRLYTSGSNYQNNNRSHIVEFEVMGHESVSQEQLLTYTATGITLAPTRKYYRQGETIKLADLGAQVVYNNGITAPLTETMGSVSEGATDTLGEKQITVTYNGNTSVSANYTIEVVEENSAKDESRDVSLSAVTYTCSNNAELSQEGGTSGPITCAYDNNANTYWHSKYTGNGVVTWESAYNNAATPDEKANVVAENLYVDMTFNEETIVDAVRYLPRTGGGNGFIMKYRILGTTDGNNWFVLTEGKWGDASSRLDGWKIAEFPGIKLKAVRLAATETWANGKASYKFANAAEIRVRSSEKEEQVEEGILVNVAGSCDITAPGTAQSGRPVSNMTDGDEETLWVQNNGTFPADVDFALENTDKVKKVVVKFENNTAYPERSLNVALSYKTASGDTEWTTAQAATKTMFKDGFSYSFETAMDISNIRISMSNPMNSETETGKFWPAIAEVEIYQVTQEVRKVELTSAAITGTGILPEVSIPSSALYALNSYKWFVDGEQVTEYTDMTKKLTLEAILSTDMSGGFGQEVKATLNDAAATAVKQDDGTLKVTAIVAPAYRRYNEPAMGSEIALTDDDRAFYENLDALSVDIVLKWDKVPENDSNDPIALFTIDDKNGHYITVWYQPFATNKGAFCFIGDGVTNGLYFSKSGWRISDTNWHKISLGISSKNQKLYSIKDGDTDNGLDWSFTNGSWLSNAWNPMQKFIGTHEWSVEEILVGKKATSGTYNIPTGTASIVDVSEDSGLQVKYIEVSSRTYTSIAGINNNSNSKVDSVISAEKAALLNETLTETDYTSESWAEYETARTGLENASTDWAICNAMDALQTAKEGLVKKVRFDQASLSLTDNIAVNFYVNVPDEYKTGAKVRLSAADKAEKEVSLGDLTAESNGLYKVSYEMNAAEMTKQISASIVLNDGTVANQITYSVKQYADTLMGMSTTSDEAKALVKAMLNYGAYSQMEFGKDTGNLANAGLVAADKPDMSAITADTITVNNAEIGSIQGAVKVSSASLLLKADTMLRLYLETEGETSLSDYKAQVNGVDAVISDSGYVQVEGIVAKALGDTYTVTVTSKSDASKTMTVKYSPFNYVKTVLSSPKYAQDVNLQNVVKALYLYNQAAKTYFDTISQN